MATTQKSWPYQMRPPKTKNASGIRPKSKDGLFQEDEVVVLKEKKFRITSIHANGKMILRQI